MRNFMDYHQEQLLKHCSVCGNWLNKAKGRAQPVYACTKQTEDLSVHARNANVSTEDSDVCLQCYCTPCHFKMSRAKQAAKNGLPFHSITAVEWSPHEEGCKVGRNLKKN